MKTPKRETMLKWKIGKAKKEFWRVFSVYIRMRDKGVCFTCGKTIPDYYNRYGDLKPGWKAGQAGHFVTAANCGLALYFHEQNVHCQCHHCNVNLSGNWLEYEKEMIARYGHEAVTEIKLLKWEGNVKYKVFDYVDKIEEYTKRIRDMEESC